MTSKKNTTTSKNLFSPRGTVVLRLIIGLIFFIIGLRFLIPTGLPLSVDPKLLQVFAPRPYLKYLWVFFSGVVVVSNAKKLYQFKKEDEASEKTSSSKKRL